MYRAFALSFASHSVKLQQKHANWTDQLSVTVPWEERGRFIAVCGWDVGKLQSKIVSSQVVSWQVFCDCLGIVCQGLVPALQTFNQHYRQSLLNFWGSRSAGNIWNDGRTRIRWFTITVHWSHHTVKAAVFGCWNMIMVAHLKCLPNSAGRLWFLVSKTEVAAMRMLFPSHPWNSGTVTDHPTHHSKTVSSSGASRNGRCAGHIE